MLAAEAAYCALEDDLQHYLDTYESTHDYDEYHFDLDEIEHDPYVLLSLLCALHEGQWTIDEVQGTLQMLFDRQYILTEDVVVETRYRTETDTWTDEDGNSHTDTYQVPYDYYICTVTLENFDLSHVPVYVMGEEQLSRYAIYMATLGNRPDLFPDSPYVNKYITGKPGDYEVPGDIWTMKPLLRCLPKRRNTSAIPMCGAAVLPPLPLIARGTFRGLSITPAGMWAGWEPRGSITSVRRPVLPNPVIWCSSKAPMTRRA